jgi:hypothetical protein
MLCSDDKKGGAPRSDTQVQLVRKSEQVIAWALAAIRSGRAAKVFMPKVSNSLACRRLRGETPMTFRSFVDGLENFMNAGLETEAQNAVRPLNALVGLYRGIDEDSGVIRIEGAVYELWLKKGGPGE